MSFFVVIFGEEEEKEESRNSSMMDAFVPTLMLLFVNSSEDDDKRRGVREVTNRTVALPETTLSSCRRLFEIIVVVVADGREILSSP